jgi:hypothetical protein
MVSFNIVSTSGLLHRMEKSGEQWSLSLVLAMKKQHCFLPDLLIFSQLSFPGQGHFLISSTPTISPYADYALTGYIHFLQYFVNSVAEQRGSFKN